MTARTAAAHEPKVGIVSLGCPKALVDSERIITKLREAVQAIAPDALSPREALNKLYELKRL